MRLSKFFLYLNCGTFVYLYVGLGISDITRLILVLCLCSACISFKASLTCAHWLDTHLRVPNDDYPDDYLVYDCGCVPGYYIQFAAGRVIVHPFWKRYLISKHQCHLKVDQYDLDNFAVDRHRERCGFAVAGNQLAALCNAKANNENTHWRTRTNAIISRCYVHWWSHKPTPVRDECALVSAKCFLFIFLAPERSETVSGAVCCECQRTWRDAAKKRTDRRDARSRTRPVSAQIAAQVHTCVAHTERTCYARLRDYVTSCWWCRKMRITGRRVALSRVGLRRASPFHSLIKSLQSISWRFS